MSRDAFRTELQRMAEINGLYGLKKDKLLDLMSADINEDGRFLNIFRGSDKRDLLLVTSLRTLAVKAGSFSMKLQWSVRHQDLVRVHASRRIMNRYVVHAVLLQTNRGLDEFWMGFHDPDDIVGMTIASDNADVAGQQIEDAAAGPAPSLPQVSGGGMSFDLTGPEEAGEAAKQAYGNARFPEAFGLYVKAIDRLHDFYVFEQFRNREPGPRDAWLVEGLVSALGAARAVDAGANVREGVREATHRLRTIASAVENAGGNPILYRRGLDGLAQYAGDIDVSDIFWE